MEIRIQSCDDALLVISNDNYNSRGLVDIRVGNPSDEGYDSFQIDKLYAAIGAFIAERDAGLRLDAAKR